MVWQHFFHAVHQKTMALPRKASSESKHMLFTSNAILLALFTAIYWGMDRANPGRHFGPQFNPVYYLYYL